MLLDELLARLARLDAPEEGLCAFAMARM